jgi:hypothetical protein
MTYLEAKNSGFFFNRRVYKDGWYKVDSRGLDISVSDLSIRTWSQEDLSSLDWWTIQIALDENINNLNHGNEEN